MNRLSIVNTLYESSLDAHHTNFNSLHEIKKPRGAGLSSGLPVVRFCQALQLAFSGQMCYSAAR